jgi:hypothetical protein
LEATAVNGVYDLEGMGLKGTPGTNATAYMSSLSIDWDKYSIIMGI